MPQQPRPTPVVSVSTYRADPLYPRIVRAVAAILETGKIVARVDVFTGMGLLSPSRIDDWRHGKGPKQRLRFTKTGDEKLEAAYSTHFIWPGKGPFHLPAAKD